MPRGLLAVRLTWSMASALLAAGCSSETRAGITLHDSARDASTLDSGEIPVDASRGANGGPGSNDGSHGAGLGDGSGGAGSNDGSAGAGSDDANVADDEENGDGGSTEAAAPSARCDPAHVWAMAESVALDAGSDFGRFGGVAANELSIAWTSTKNAVFVADRASRAVAFGAAVGLDPAPTVLAVDRVALAPSGMTVIGVVADRSTFAGWNRAGSEAAWGELPPSQFSNLAAMVAEGGGALSEPVLGADGASLFFLVTAPGSAPLLAESTWDPKDGEWATGTGFANAELASADASHRRRPTGASSDGLTLFFYDETAASERAAWRSSAGGPFAQFVDLPGLDEAAPDRLCDTLYGVAPGDAGGPAIDTVF